MQKLALISLTSALFLASCNTPTAKTETEAEVKTAAETKVEKKADLGNHAPSLSYFMDLACDSDPNLKIQTVGIHSNYTEFVIVYHNATNKPATGLRTSPTGHKDAFFLRSLKTKELYPLLGTTGIPVDSRGIDIHPSEEISFRLIFAQIPAGEYELIEGKNQNEDWEYWNFSKINLKK